jgi:hypothetical protein
VLSNFCHQDRYGCVEIVLEIGVERNIFLLIGQPRCPTATYEVMYLLPLRELNFTVSSDDLVALFVHVNKALEVVTCRFSVIITSAKLRLGLFRVKFVCSIAKVTLLQGFPGSPSVLTALIFLHPGLAFYSEEDMPDDNPHACVISL